jgi:hypothetical protein
MNPATPAVHDARKRHLCRAHRHTVCGQGLVEAWPSIPPASSRLPSQRCLEMSATAASMRLSGALPSSVGEVWFGLVFALFGQTGNQTN